MVKQSAGTIMLTWSAVRGHTYQVEFKTNFTSSPWMNVTNVIAGTCTTTAPDCIAVDSVPRFYRVVLMPLARSLRHFARWTNAVFSAFVRV